MSITDRPAANGTSHPGVLVIPFSATGPPVVAERPAAPSAVLGCAERLPRDILLRLAVLSRKVAVIRRDHVAPPELSLRLDDVAIGLAALTQSIHDETVLHFVGRRV